MRPPRLVDRLFARSFVRSVAVLAGGTALAQSLSVLAAPLLTRIYLPEDLGRFGLYFTFLSFAVVGAALRYEAAVVVAADRREAANLVSLSLLIGCPTALISAGVLYLLIDKAILGFGTLPGYAAVLVAPALVLTNVFTTLRYWFVREERYAPISRALVVRGGARAVSQVGLGVPLAGWLGLPLGDLVGRFFGMGRLVREAWPAIRGLAFPIRRPQLREALRAQRRFPMVLFPSSVINILALSLPLPFIVYLYGPVAGGYYALLQRVVSLPVSLLGASVADAFYGRMATQARQTPERARRAFERTAFVLFLVGALPALLLLTVGEPLFGVVFGDAWSEAGVLAGAMAPWALAQFVVSPLSRVVFVFHGQLRKLVYDGFTLLATSTVFVVSMKRGLSLPQTVGVLSVANVAAYGLYYFLIFDLVKRRTQSSEGEADLGEPR